MSLIFAPWNFTEVASHLHILRSSILRPLYLLHLPGPLLSSHIPHLWPLSIPAFLGAHIS